jgi:hypothetical protein
MKLQGDSIVDTVIEYANVKFGVELSVDQVSQQLKSMTFGQTLELVDAIKKENDEDFSSLIDMNVAVESGYGTASTYGGYDRASARQSDQETKNAQRRDTNMSAKSARTGSNTRTVAGANKTPTGAKTAVDPEDEQRAANTATAQHADAQAAQNAQELERLRQLIKGRK